MMKLHLGLSGLIFLMVAAGSARAELPHLDLEMTGAEYRAILEDGQRGEHWRLAPADALQPILVLGKRNLDWIAHINSFRSKENQLELSTEATQKGYPIETPTFNNRQLTLDSYEELRATLPGSLRAVLLENAPFTREPPIADEAFLEQVRKVDRVYQKASRWLLQEPHLLEYAARSQSDIRGYYFLSKEPDLATQLQNWTELDAANKAKLRPWLVGQCRNQIRTFEECEAELTRAEEKASGVTDFFHRYLPRAKATFDAYFRIQNPRREAVWNAQNPDLFVLPFRTPERPEVQSWLSDNIEDEWKFGTWNLRLAFTQSGWGLAHVVFKPGATPNVNGLGGSRITMDANRSIDEYSSRWTIRHEFGHVLGLPDCYIEFYDRQQKVMVQYQIDVENVMCSRRGKFKPLHFEELKSAYFRE